MMKITQAMLLLGLAVSPFVGANTPFESGFAPSPLNTPTDTRCNLSLGSSTVDYGKQTRWQLKDASNGHNRVTPGQRTLMLSVVCPYTQSLRLVLRGDHAADGDLRYGNNGSLRIRLTDAQVDGISVQVATTTPDGAMIGGPQSSILLKPDQSFTATTNGQVIKGKTFNARLEIEPQIPEKDARVAFPQESESNIRLELIRP